MAHIGIGLDSTEAAVEKGTGGDHVLTCDYKRHGTASLFAAINMASREVIGKSNRRYHHQNVRSFKRKWRRRFPVDSRYI